MRRTFNHKRVDSLIRGTNRYHFPKSLVIWQHTLRSPWVYLPIDIQHTARSWMPSSRPNIAGLNCLLDLQTADAKRLLTLIVVRIEGVQVWRASEDAFSPRVTSLVESIFCAGLIGPDPRSASRKRRIEQRCYVLSVIINAGALPATATHLLVKRCESLYGTLRDSCIRHVRCTHRLDVAARRVAQRVVALRWEDEGECLDQPNLFVRILQRIALVTYAKQTVQS